MIKKRDFINIKVLTFLIIVESKLIGAFMPFVSGGIPFIQDSTIIELVDADIEIGIAQDFVDFLGIYKFFNPGEKYNAKIIFPSYYFPTNLEHNPFSVKINEKWHKDISVKKGMRSWNTAFKSKDTTLLEVGYKIITDFVSLPVLCKHSLVTGACWAGRVKKCNVKITFITEMINPLFDEIKVGSLFLVFPGHSQLTNFITTEQYERDNSIPENFSSLFPGECEFVFADVVDSLSVFPQKFKIEGTSIEWEFNDFEPSFNLVVPIDYRIWQNK